MPGFPSQCCEAYSFAYPQPPSEAHFVILPLFPFLKYLYRDLYLIVLRRVFFLVQNCISSTYFFVLLIMATERFLAVFWPFTFRQMIKKLHYIAVTFYALEMTLTLVVSINYFTPLSDRAFLLVLQTWNMLNALVTAILYVFIAVRLIQLTRKQRLTQPVAMTSTGDTNTAHALPKDQNAVNHSKETISIKLAVVLFLLLLLSFGPHTLAAVFKNYYLTYISFFNHIANPWAYYVINPTFRKDFKELFKRK